MLVRSIFLLLAAVAGFCADSGLGPLPPGATIYSGGAVPTSGQVVTSNGTTLAGDAGLTYTAASDLLVVNHNAAALPGIPAADDTVIQVGGLDATTARVLVDGFGGTPTFAGRRADGTNSVKTGLVSNDVLVQMAGLGYEPTTPAYTTGAKASVQLVANETWSSAAQSTKILFNVVPTGSSTTSATVWQMIPGTSTATFFCGTSSLAGRMAVNGAAGTTRDVLFNTAGSGRWQMGASSTAEGGANAGSNFQIVAYDDAAAGIDTPFQIARVAGGLITVTRPFKTTDTTASTTVTTGAFICGGGGGFNGQVSCTTLVTSSGNVTSASRFTSSAAATTAAGTGVIAIWRSGGTYLGTPSGSAVFQTDLASATGYYFTSGATTPVLTSVLGAGGGLHGGVASIVTAAGTTVLAIGSAQTQVFTGSTTQSVTMPAANLYGAGISVHYTIVNRSTGTVTLNRAGSDTFNAAATSFACVTVTVTEVWSDGVSAWYTK